MLKRRITERLFASYLDCPRKAFLQIRGRTGDKTSYENHAERMDNGYLSAVIAKLEAQHQPRMILRKGRLTCVPPVTDWRVLVADQVCAGNLSTGKIVLLNRADHQGQIHPVHCQRYAIITARDKLLLGYKGLLLNRLTGAPPVRGILVHGDAFLVTEIPLLPLTRKVEDIVSRVLRLSEGHEERVFLNQHCNLCEFHAACKTKALEEDNLSLLQGMGAGAIQAQNRKGIFTVNQLSFTFRPRKPPKRAKNPSNPRHYALQAQAIREKKAYIHGRPEIPASERCLYFDIEGVPGRESYYLVGVLAVEVENEQYRAFWANDMAEQAPMITEFCRFVGTFPNTPLFHYGNYDAKALREIGQLIPENERHLLEKVLSATFNVLPVVYSHLYFPLHSIRLREVAGFLGCKFSSRIGSGMESVVFREEWEISRSNLLKEELIAYNREDCEALRAVCDFVRKGVALASARERVPGREERIALSDGLRRAGEGNRPVFKKAEFVLPEFEQANRCAYFDYQRERVYARTKKRIAQRRHHRLPHTVRRISQDTDVVVKCRKCSQCGSNRLSLQKTVRRRLIDLKFFKKGIGVKRWQPNYAIHQYRCRRCGAIVTPPGVLLKAESRSIYGHNLMCWCLYHNVVGKQSLLQVERSLDDIFGLRLPYKNVYRFRSVIAAYYRPLRDEILRAILDEDVINIDETPVNLRKTTGYVWVLATADKVYYVYKESREGGFLKSLLVGFSGILVSDFFTAYDSLGCRHQKCLVHLMRDINDDLRRHPFDRELRGIAQEFGGFLVNAVATIDRWGLKSYHLHKHLKDADRMLQRISRKRLASEQTIKYQKRFEKYADSLFTFLRHDNVPWNNNNAEHAVHYFAKVRRFTDGTFTNSSIEDLLTLVTVIQTCEYSGVNPLRFLLSGETSLDGMAKQRVRRLHKSKEPSHAVRA